MKFRSLFIALFLLLLSDAATLIAQENPNITWKLLTPTVSGRRGSVVLVKVQAKIAPKSHLYTPKQYPKNAMAPQPLEVTVGDQPLSIGGGLRGPTPTVKHDVNFEIDTEFWDGDITLTVPVRISKHAKAGKTTGWINFYFMTCDDRACQIPTDKKIEFSVNIRR